MVAVSEETSVFGCERGGDRPFTGVWGEVWETFPMRKPRAKGSLGVVESSRAWTGGETGEGAKKGPYRKGGK